MSRSVQGRPLTWVLTQRRGAPWTLVRTLSRPKDATGVAVGWSVALDRGRALVGASESERDIAGQAFLFDAHGGGVLATFSPPPPVDWS